jgi:translation elongation factor EF-1beta
MKLSTKQMKRSLHSTFLNNCVEEEIIPFGLKLKLKIYIGDGSEGFQNSIDNLLDKVSLNILRETCRRTTDKINRHR